MWLWIELIASLSAYVCGYISTARWLFYTDRAKHEETEERYNSAVARADERYEKEIVRYRNEERAWLKDKSKWESFTKRYPIREWVDQRDYRFKSRRHSEQRALGLALIWFILLAIELGKATPRVLAKVLFSKPTRYERKLWKAEMDRTIKELERSELP